MQMSKVNRRQTAPMIQNSLIWSTKFVQAPYHEELKSLDTTNNPRTQDSKCKLYSKLLHTVTLYSNNDIYFKSNLLKSK